jgi:AraC-like DNA-binding protein
VTNAKNQIKFYNNITILFGYGLAKNTHSNHCVMIVVAEELLTITIDSKKIITRGIIIKSDTSHSIKAEGGLTISVYIDPESKTGNSINCLFRQSETLKLEDNNVERIITFFRKTSEVHLTESEVVTFLNETLLQGNSENKAYDERIEKILQHIRSSENYKIKFTALQHLCGLSESRLIHLFKKETGITIRKYILWCRVQQAIRAIASGQTIKQAARQAGFTDAAHLHRTFVAMLGVTPSALFK